MDKRYKDWIRGAIFIEKVILLYDDRNTIKYSYYSYVEMKWVGKYAYIYVSSINTINDNHRDSFVEEDLKCLGYENWWGIVQDRSRWRNRLRINLNSCPRVKYILPSYTYPKNLNGQPPTLFPILISVHLSYYIKHIVLQTYFINKNNNKQSNTKYKYI